MITVLCVSVVSPVAKRPAAGNPVNGRANLRPTEAARRSTSALDYNCRNQLILTMSERAVGMVPFNTACRSL